MCYLCAPSFRSHLNLDDAAAGKCACKLKASQVFNLKKVDISLNRVSMGGAQMLGEVLATLPRLTSLSFSHNLLGNTGAAALARCFEENTVLTTLNLDHNGIGPLLPPELMKLTWLKTLTLRHNKVEQVPINSLKRLSQLDLEDNPVYLAMFLECELEDEYENSEKRRSRRRALTHLSLAWAAWDDLDMPRAQAEMSKVRQELDVAGPGVTSSIPGLVWEIPLEFGLEKPKIGTEIHNEKLAMALQKKHVFSEEELLSFNLQNLTHNDFIKVDSEGATGFKYWKPTMSLGDKIREAQNLIVKRTEALGPTFVRVEDPAQIMVGNSIERASIHVRRGGTDVSLQDQRVGDVGMTSMAEVLRNNQTVTWLDFSGCDVGPAGAKALGPFLSECTSLQALWLGSNPRMGDDGCSELAVGLAHNAALCSRWRARNLDFSGVGFASKTRSGAWHTPHNYLVFIQNGEIIHFKYTWDGASSSKLINTASGLKWLKIEGTQPSNGQDLAHSELARALLRKTEFTQQEWEKMDIRNLRMDHFVKSGNSYFTPADTVSNTSGNLRRGSRGWDRDEEPSCKWPEITIKFSTDGGDVTIQCWQCGIKANDDLIGEVTLELSELTCTGTTPADAHSTMLPRGPDMRDGGKSEWPREFAIAEREFGVKKARTLCLQKSQPDRGWLPGISKLDLSGCNMGATGCTAVVKALQANPSLREIRLACNTFGDEGAMAVARSLKDMRNLQELDLSGSHIRTAGQARLAEEFKFHVGLSRGNFWR